MNILHGNLNLKVLTLVRENIRYICRMSAFLYRHRHVDARLRGGFHSVSMGLPSYMYEVNFVGFIPTVDDTYTQWHPTRPISHRLGRNPRNNGHDVMLHSPTSIGICNIIWCYTWHIYIYIYIYVYIALQSLKYNTIIKKEDLMLRLWNMVLQNSWFRVKIEREDN